MQIDLVKYAIRLSWDYLTAYSMPHCNLIDGSNSATGQCAVSSVVLQDYCGGVIKKGLVNGIIKHYWNVINDEKIDLTFSQFVDPVCIINEQDVDRKKLIEDKAFSIRYSILKERVDMFIRSYSDIEKRIACCIRCDKNMIEHFQGSTISFGKTNDVLIVGEAPANNGWRKSGKVWMNKDGNLIASGKRLQNLLELCDIKLFDCSFIEAMKCFPLLPRNIKNTSCNCSTFLFEQIALLSPRIVIPLGKVATNLLLSNNEPLGKTVGRYYPLKINNSMTYVFPIFHPSPSSPKSWKDNMGLMEKLNSLIKGGAFYAT